MIDYGKYFSEHDQTPLEEKRQLLIDFKNGQEGAFRKVFDRLIRPLMSYFIGKYWSITTDEIEDVVAEKFAILYEQRSSMNSLDHICSWMFLCTDRALVFEIKRKKLIRTCPIMYLDGEDIIERLVTFADPIEVQTTQEKALALVRKGVEKLPHQQKIVIQLLYFFDKTPKQIAEIIGLSPQTILNHKTAAILKLRKFALPQYEKVVYG